MIHPPPVADAACPCKKRNVKVGSGKRCHVQATADSSARIFSCVAFLLLLSAASLPTVDAQKTTETLASPIATQILPPTPIPSFFPGSNENVEDTLCTLDDLERANDSQLNVIFHELEQTNFFQHFVVDLEVKCNMFKDEEAKSKPAAPKAPPKPAFGTGQTSQTSSFSMDSFPWGNDEDDGDDFLCTGGADELDEDAVPLCSVDTGDSDDMLAGGGFSAWEEKTDEIVMDEDPPCDSDEEEQDSGIFDIPDSFWMDICSNIRKGEGTKVVNLELNPERNTYYNGSHVWDAIYKENRITTDDTCLEERVLYRLLSGMHTSTTLSIAKNYYPPSKRKNRENWEANPQYFMERFADHPEYIRNLHFSYIVMLRAIKKARDYLYNYDISSTMPLEDTASTNILLRRLLDTTILRSCSDVFSAFDESVMFQEDDNKELRESFKEVFHKISGILDCVQCQQCKLHGKLTMLGYGTALKILFVKSPKNLVLERNEVVALINTAARLSKNLVEVRELTTMYWEEERTKIANLEIKTEVSKGASVVPDKLPSQVSSTPFDSLDVLDVTVGVISNAGRLELISMEREKELVNMALARHPELMILGKHYSKDPERFVAMATDLGELESGGRAATKTSLPALPPDAIVVGSGLSGLAASLNILDRGGTVVILEKEHLVGGNSNKASSGINGYCPHNDTCSDSMDAFRNDTIKSAGTVADLDLIDVLVTKSSQAVSWLRDRANVDLSLLAQLGGHRYKRTHRPSNGMAGAEIIYNIQKTVRSFEKTGRVKILVDTQVKELLTEDGGDRVVGVRAESTKDGTVQEILADNVILATGGFASDRSSGSYLDQHRPELMSFPATAGAFSTGDGITMATTLGAATRDMDKVQIHPTGWVDPKDPGNPSKILAAELMRGVGGMLIDHSGRRFANELGTRAYVTDQMLKHDEEFVKTGKWNPSTEVPTFFLVLSSSAAADGKKHVDLYSHKGLLTKVEGVDALSNHMGMSTEKITKTISQYQLAAKKGIDEFGKQSFRGVPAENLKTETFYVGTVTPVLHYCMGGIKINPECSVMREDGKIIEGLHAAGEVTGGVHGANRLGGNSLLECTVFGTVVGQKVPIKEEGTYRMVIGDEEISTEQLDPGTVGSDELPNIQMDELARHNTEEDLWVAIHGTVYDFTEFAHEHPAGFKSIFDLAGTDGTAAFDAVHNLGMLDDFEQDRRGILV